MDHLIGQALLNPALMQTLLARATPQNQFLLLAALGTQMRRVSLVSAAQSNGGQDQRQVPQGAGVKLNSLAGLADFRAGRGAGASPLGG